MSQKYGKATLLGLNISDIEINTGSLFIDLLNGSRFMILIKEEDIEIVKIKGKDGYSEKDRIPTISEESSPDTVIIS